MCCSWSYCSHKFCGRPGVFLRQVFLVIIVFWFRKHFLVLRYHDLKPFFRPLENPVSECRTRFPFLNPLLESKSSYDPVIRGNFLFNLAKETFVFDKNFENVTIVSLLDFENIPEQARRYITIRASRIFHDRTLGANALHRFSQQDELVALSILKQAEASVADHSIFNSHDQYKTIARTRSYKLID